MHSHKEINHKSKEVPVIINGTWGIALVILGEKRRLIFREWMKTLIFTKNWEIICCSLFFQLIISMRKVLSENRVWIQEGSRLVKTVKTKKLADCSKLNNWKDMTLKF